MTSQTDPFRVVIVGAGVAGLTLAHSLDLAGIDYVLIDKGIVAPPWGISITLHPHACRILHQIDCFEAVSSQCTPMELFCLRRPDEKVYHEHRFFEAVKKRYVWLFPYFHEVLGLICRVRVGRGIRLSRSNAGHYYGHYMIDYGISRESSSGAGYKTSRSATARYMSLCPMGASRRGIWWWARTGCTALCAS
jgi:hypothetical protein